MSEHNEFLEHHLGSLMTTAGTDLGAATAVAQRSSKGRVAGLTSTNSSTVSARATALLSPVRLRSWSLQRPLTVS